MCRQDRHAFCETRRPWSKKPLRRPSSLGIGITLVFREGVAKGDADSADCRVDTVLMNTDTSICLVVHRLNMTKHELCLRLCIETVCRALKSPTGFDRSRGAPCAIGAGALA